MRVVLISCLLMLSACASAPPQPCSQDSQPIQDISAKPRNQQDVEKDTPTEAETSCKHDDRTFRCVEYVRNYDADTVTFNIPNVPAIIGKEMPIRLFGIDVAEIKGSSRCEKEVAQQAKLFVQKVLMSAKRIDLVDVGREKYFRLLAKIRADGKDLTDMLIQKGFGYPYFGETKAKDVDWCRPLKEQGL
jgi:endonuclease YncB( thermonuclease family)